MQYIPEAEVQGHRVMLRNSRISDTKPEAWYRLQWGSNRSVLAEVITVIIAETINEVRAYVNEQKRKGLTVGLVPTMGYLHEGHASLVRESAKLCDITVASVFLNPTQFAPNEDLAKYPRDFERDCRLLEENGCDLVFHPSVAEMYPEGWATYVEIQSEMPHQLCGKTRPTHFRGVCTVVNKLFNIVTPDKAFFGQKDAQQLAVIKQMVRDMSMAVEVIGCPIVRETDGLAMSSRNTYLSSDERRAAIVLSQALAAGRRLYEEGCTDTDKLVSEMTKLIEAEPLARIDYVSAVDNVSMMPVAEVSKPTLLAMAVYVGSTRLIDNTVIGNAD